LEKEQIVVATKIDALSDRSFLNYLENYFKERGYEFCSISAITGEGLENLRKLLFEKFFQRTMV